MPSLFHRLSSKQFKFYSPLHPSAEGVSISLLYSEIINIFIIFMRSKGGVIQVKQLIFALRWF